MRSTVVPETASLDLFSANAFQKNAVEITVHLYGIFNAP